MYEAELQAAIEAALEAQKVILEVYARDFEVETKSDDSPVTEADKRADELIREYLGARFPDYGFLTEESADTPLRLKQRAIWIVDPVDGTKEFVSRNGGFVTNIALCVDHEIVVGVINAPALGVYYYAVKGQGAYKVEGGVTERIHVSDRGFPVRALRSISFFNAREAAFIAKYHDKFAYEPECVGAALKFCRIAEGSAEIFCRFSSGTKEWDVASGDIIVTEAGGVMVQPNGERFRYNREDVYNRLGYVIANKPENILPE